MKIDDDLTVEKTIYYGEGLFFYLASYKGSPEKYALKQYSKEIFDLKPDSKKYFDNEVKILKDVNHTIIIRFKGIKETEKNYYIVTEYCNGRDLGTYLEKYFEMNHKALSEEIVQHIMTQ